MARDVDSATATTPPPHPHPPFSRSPRTAGRRIQNRVPGFDVGYHRRSVPEVDQLPDQVEADPVAIAVGAPDVGVEDALPYRLRDAIVDVFDGDQDLVAGCPRRGPDR